MRTVLIFRYELLPISETFIQSQARALKDFQPCYAGIQHAVRSLPIPEDSIVLMKNNSVVERVKRRVFLHTGRAPVFYRQLRERAPALIHAHFAPDGAVALPLVSELEVPIIVTLHGYDVASSERRLKEGFHGRLYLRRKQQLLKTANLFICVSEFIRQSAIEAGYPESKLRVHHIGVDLNLFAPRVQARQQKLVLFVGRLIEQKGCRYLIEAMQLVQQKCPEATLVLIGDGPSRPSLEALARQRRISYQFLGSQPSSAVRDWLGMSQVFCAPSVTGSNGAREGLPTVFAEAQAVGVPAVGFKHGGIPEVVLDGETGLLAPEGDHKILAEHLLRYLTDETFRGACSQRAIEWIQEQFDLDRQTRELESIYREITCTGPGADSGGYN